jgi:hypothetical protein
MSGFTIRFSPENVREIPYKNRSMKLKPGRYQHYKGPLYEVIGTARNSETLEEFAVYKALYQPEGENLWIRPLTMFTEEVEVSGKKIPRFNYLGT